MEQVANPTIIDHLIQERQMLVDVLILAAACSTVAVLGALAWAWWRIRKEEVDL